MSEPVMEWEHRHHMRVLSEARARELRFLAELTVEFDEREDI